MQRMPAQGMAVKSQTGGLAMAQKGVSHFFRGLLCFCNIESFPWPHHILASLKVSFRLLLAMTTNSCKVCMTRYQSDRLLAYQSW